MRNSLGAATITLLWASVLGGCKDCSSTPTTTPVDAAPPEPMEVHRVEVLPPPTGWTFERVRLGPRTPGTAIPTGCRLRESLVHAKVLPSTKFVAAPNALGALVIADADVSETPPRLTGVAAMKLDPTGPTSNPVGIPWREAAALPRLAFTKSGTWLAAYAEAAEDKLSQVFVFQNGHAVPIGTGDKFDAVDMNCDDDQCVLLTTRLGRVHAAGADVWIGKPTEPVTSWRRIEIIPKAGDSDARPSTIARVDAILSTDGLTPRHGPAVALVEGTDLVFWGIPLTDEPYELGRIQAPHGIVDAVMLDRPIALTYQAPTDDDGCTRQGGFMRFSRIDEPGFELQAPVPPTYGAIRPLLRGAIAAYLAPVSCGSARKVLYAVVLNDAGAPISDPVAVSDASSFAVAAHDEEADLWIQRDDEVVWARMICSPP